SCQGSLLAASGSYDPYRLALRAGAAAANRLPDPAGLRRIAPPGAAPGRRTAVFRDPYCIE
ncbi:MAG TPA: hypothetical protein VHT00_08705, partial [Stellaceae bacterium]|nr:hypothetical protein [Stellaceae bacterium]